MFSLKNKIKAIKKEHAKRVRRIKKKKAQRLLEKKAVQFNFGQQDQVDLISYSGLIEESAYLQIGDRYVRTLFISGYPYVASVGWLNMLINFNHNIDISHHIEQINPLLALPKLNRKITELESTKRTMQKQGKVIGSEITDPLESAIELKDKIQRGQEKLFQVSIYMTITADSVANLNKITTISWNCHVHQTLLHQDCNFSPARRIANYFATRWE